MGSASISARSWIDPSRRTASRPPAESRIASFGVGTARRPRRDKMRDKRDIGRLCRAYSALMGGWTVPGRRSPLAPFALGYLVPARWAWKPWPPTVQKRLRGPNQSLFSPPTLCAGQISHCFRRQHSARAKSVTVFAANTLRGPNQSLFSPPTLCAGQISHCFRRQHSAQAKSVTVFAANTLRGAISPEKVGRPRIRWVRFCPLRPQCPLWWKIAPRTQRESPIAN